jgi:uncharacterized protein GlcG (DUF336 family)
MRPTLFATTSSLAALIGALTIAAQTADKTRPRATVERRSVTMEAALAIAQVVLRAGKERGSDVAVAVVDQAGTPLVVLRADNGTQQFVEGATQKAWTAVNFRASTREMFEDIKKGKEDFSQLPQVPKALFLMGGVPLKDGNTVVGGVGVAGAVSGLEDDAMAQLAVKAFAEMLKK